MGFANHLWMEAGVAVAGVQLAAAVAVLSAGKFETRLRSGLPYVVSVAVGVLLATGSVHLLPEAVEALGNGPRVWLLFTGTILALFCFERLFQVFSGVSAEPAQGIAEKDCEDVHHHSHAHGAAKPSALLLGSVTHSLVDGTSVAAAFAVNVRLGWVTALAVGLHEIPHRLGDFALLLHMGVARSRAAGLAIAAGLSSLLGWGVVVLLGDSGQSSSGAGRVAWLLPVSAGSFLYISLVDLLPELFQEHKKRIVIWQIVCLAAGVLLAVGLTHLPGA